MAGLSENETTSITGAIKEIALRLGSTRWLNLATILLFLGWIVSMSMETASLALKIGSGLSFLTLLSFHFKPHADRKNKDNAPVS